MNGVSIAVTVGTAVTSGVSGVLLTRMFQSHKDKNLEIAVDAVTRNDLRLNTEAVGGLRTDVQRIDRSVSELKGVMTTHLNIRHHPRTGED